MKIKKGDTVLIISGKDRGRKSKVLQVFPKENRILVEGVNLRKKHRKPRKMKEKGQIVEMPASLDVSNIKLICPKCEKATRVGHKEKPKAKSIPRTEPKVLARGQKSKVRVCKKCGQEI